MQTEPLLTRKELASFLKVTTRTIDNLREKGMPTIMVGASPRFEAATVKAWLIDAAAGLVAEVCAP